MTEVIARDEVDELLDFLNPDERSTLERDLRAIAPKTKGKPVPDAWRQRIPLVYSRYASAPFAKRHEEFWDWENAIELESAPDPFVAIWARGGAKSTSAEMLTADLGCRNRRRYCLYVRMTQDKADASVENVAALLESDEVARHFPEHAKRKVGKFGNAKGWRRNRVWTAAGFAVDALGLDTASRGVKLEDQRPDLIIFDDIDDLQDGPAATKKKIDTITKSILPAGSNNVAVLFIQNLIIRDGVASQLADGRADFLSKRIVSGPFPAVEGFKYEWRVDAATGMRRAVIIAGHATWEGQPLEACQRFIDTWGLSAFVKEAQHKVQGKAEGVSLRFNPTRHYADHIKTDQQWVNLVQRSKAFGGIDFGAWRFGFTFWIVTTAGIVIRVDEFFSQREGLAVRAQKIHELCERNGLDDPSPKTCPIWGDAANPQDIMEINLAFKAGWKDEDDNHVTSKLRVIAVAAEHKLRKVAVERINNALDQNTLLFRRDVYVGESWMYAMNAGSPGTELKGSRLIWEIGNWAVPLPKEGEAQSQNLDDDTADGADMIASARYALMSHWRPGKEPVDADVIEDDRARKFDSKAKKFVEYPHVADLLDGPGARRRPAVHAPRPRIGR
jgi:hypothetical protein